MPYRSIPTIGAIARFDMQMIGKPYAGDLQVRFDEEDQDCVRRWLLTGHDIVNDGYSQLQPNSVAPVLSSCLIP